METRMREIKSMKKRKTVKIPKSGLRASGDIVPNSFNPDDNTIEVVFSTGAKGKRGFFNPYFEELSMKKSDVRLERVNKGAPVLFNHVRGSDPSAIKGRAISGSIKNKQGIAKLKLSDREDNQGFVRDVETGVITNISVGYAVHKYQDVTKKGDEFPTYRAVDWEVLEISFVDIPFDMDAQSRSLDDQETYECEIENSEERNMNIETKIREACKSAGLTDEVAEDMISREISLDEIDGEIKRAIATQEKEQTPEVTPEVEADPAPEAERSVDPAPEETPAVDVEAERKVAAETERTRITEIQTITRDLGIDEKLADEKIKDGTTLEEFRKFAIETKAANDNKNKTNNHNIEVGDMDQRELRMKGVESALLNRFKKDKYELKTEGAEFRHNSLVDLGRRFLEAEGVNTTGMSTVQIAERSLHSSSDFKEILANVANKSLRDAYAEAPQTFMPFTNEVEVNDFKEISRTQLHSGAQLSKVNEKGEYEHTTLSESAEKYSIQTYGKIIGITRQTLVNDDLGAFTRIPGMMGAKSRSLESKLIWAIITSNPQMADGFNLFSTEHGNIGTGVINVANVNIGMSKMMLQKDLDDELIDIMPAYLAGPSVQGATIKQFLGATVPSQDGEVNPFKGDLEPIIERRLDASSALQWYMMANKSMIDMIEIARLSGEAGPVISQKEGFEVDGLKLKVRYDFGAKVLDHRGFYRSTGA